MRLTTAALLVGLLLVGLATARADSLPEKDSINEDSVMALAAPGIRVGWRWPRVRLSKVDSATAAKFYSMKVVIPDGRPEDFRTLESDMKRGLTVRFPKGPFTGEVERVSESEVEWSPDATGWFRVEPPGPLADALPGVELYVTGEDYHSAIFPLPPPSARHFIVVYRSKVYPQDCFVELLRDVGYKFTESEVQHWLRALVIVGVMKQMLGFIVNDWKFGGLEYYVKNDLPGGTVTGVLPGTPLSDGRLRRDSAGTVIVPSIFTVPCSTKLITSVYRTVGLPFKAKVTVEVSRDTDSAGRTWVAPMSPFVRDLKRLRSEAPAVAEPDWYVSAAGLQSTEYSTAEAQLYRYDISPVIPETGIHSGCVIAYGHPMPRPYLFEVRSDATLWVNGIQVQPPLRNSKYWAAFDREYGRLESIAAARPPDTMWAALRRRFGQEFRQLVRRPGAESSDIADSLLNLARAWPGVHTDPAPKVTVAPDLSYAFLDVRYGQRRQHELTMCYRAEPVVDEGMLGSMEKDDLERGALESRRRNAREDSLWLVQGGTVVYGDHSGGRYSPDFPLRVWMTMTADSIDWSAKMSRLRLGPLRCVKELMYNFAPDEYRSACGHGER